MRKIVRKIVEILDATPAEYGKKRQRGQSMVEMALTAPLLIVLFASMVEIGWFANNYLTLLDVSRAGARRGTTLQDRLSPLQWDDRASHVPLGLLTSPGDDQYQMQDKDLDSDGNNDLDIFRVLYRNYDPAEDQCFDFGLAHGFYNDIACLMLQSLTPLRLNNTDIGTFGEADWRAAQDDIVISAFAVEAVPTVHLLPDGDPPDPTLDDDVLQAVVVGRYPPSANECEVQFNPANPTQIIPKPVGSRARDPFDFNGNGFWDVYSNADELKGITLYDQDLIDDGVQIVNADFQEVAGFDQPSAFAADVERHLGFSWFGNHRIRGEPDNLACLGSEWTVEEIERLMNLPAFIGKEPVQANEDAQRMMLPSQGVILVEIFWDHKPLLNLPFFQPIYRVFGDRTTIEVWALFPLPATEPFILFPEPAGP